MESVAEVTYYVNASTLRHSVNALFGDACWQIHIVDKVSDHPILILGHEMTLSRHTLGCILNVVGGKGIEQSIGCRWRGAKKKSGATCRGGL